MMLKIKVFALAAASFLCLANFAADGRDYVLTTDAVPSAVIVISANPTKSAQFAAFELQYHLREITNSIFEIIPEGTKELSDDLIKIHVGETEAAKTAGLTNDLFKAQEWIVKFSDRTIFLTGKDAQVFDKVVYDMDNLPSAGNWPKFWEERGSLHAVYDFLEKCCEVRWFNHTDYGTVVPRKNTLVLEKREIRRSPGFLFRDAIGAIGNNPGAYDPYVSLWPADTDGFKKWSHKAYANLARKYPDASRFNAAKNTMTNLFLLRMKNGGERRYCNHSLYGYFDRYWEKSTDPNKSELFVERRPQYFAKGYEGKPNQLCYTNRDLIKQVAQDARDYFDGKKTPSEIGISWLKLPNPFPLEPMDNSFFCKCPECQK
ncbi:MAG: hypothetical protein JW808_04260, partial [Victivallales bacterium]|nr:hypothetical protein [Victivallales bacterium]